MLKNLILDIGNVICEWNPERLCSSAFENKQDHAAALRDTIAHADWLALDRGTITLEKAIANAQQRSQLDPKGIEAIYRNLPASLTLIDSTAMAMKEAHKAGVPIYILSNMQHEAWAYMKANYDVWSYVQGVILSCEANLIKPEAAIYEHLCQQFGLQASECVFVDDIKENIDAAIACGWQGVQLTDFREGGNVIRELVQQINQKKSDA